MGMDLSPINAKLEGLSYNWDAWLFLMEKLNEWGVDTREFSGSNDGELISASTCRAVADALEAHVDEIPGEKNRKFFRAGIEAWRHSNGFCQW
jgi:hypothetical protein